jgi:hypothetical protein
MQSTHVGEARGSIWRLADGDIETVVAFSVAAWAPVFASLKTELGSEIFGATFPDWRSTQAAGVEAVCTAPGKGVWVAVAEDRPVGFTLCALIDVQGEDLALGAVDHVRQQPDQVRAARNHERWVLDLGARPGRLAPPGPSAIATGNASRPRDRLRQAPRRCTL